MAEIRIRNIAKKSAIEMRRMQQKEANVVDR